MPPVNRGVVERRERLRDERVVLRAELSVATCRALEVHTPRCLVNAFGHADQIRIRNWAGGRVGQNYSLARVRWIIADMRKLADMVGCFYPDHELVRQPVGYWVEDPGVIDNILETEHYRHRHRCARCGVFVSNGSALCKPCHNKERAERARRAHKQALWFLAVAKTGRLDQLVCRYPAR